VRRERKPSAQHGGGFLTRLRQFLHDTRAEMRRVSWPTANEVKNTTIITLVAVIFFALYLFGVDRVWAFLIEHCVRSWAVERSERVLMNQWFILHTYSGHEKKVCESLKARVAGTDLEVRLPKSRAD